MRRVRRPKNKEIIFDALCKKEGTLRFDTMKDLIVLAACIGYTKGVRVFFFKLGFDTVGRL